MQNYGPERWYDWLESAIERDRATARAWCTELKQIYDEEIREREMERENEKSEGEGIGMVMSDLGLGE